MLVYVTSIINVYTNTDNLAIQIVAIVNELQSVQHTRCYQTELCNYIALHDVSLVYILYMLQLTCQVHEFQSFLHNKYISMQQLLTYAMLPLLKNTSELITLACFTTLGQVSYLQYSHSEMRATLGQVSYLQYFTVK